MENTKKSTGNYQISIEGANGKELKVILSPPSRFVVQAAMAKMLRQGGETDMIGAGEIVFNSCKIECDKEIEKDEVLLVSVFLKCFELVEIKEASLKKI